MKKLCALLPLFLFVLNTSLSAQVIRVETVVSRYVEEDKTELIGARAILVTTIPITASFRNVTVSFLGTETDNNAIRLSTRLAEKLDDGSLRRHEADTLTIAVGQTAIIRVGDYKLELTPGITEPPGFRVNFPGGTLTDLLKNLSESRTQTVFNLVGDKGDLQTEIPPLSLKVYSSATLVAALNGILNPKGLAIGTSRTGVSDLSGRKTVYVLQKLSEPDANLPPDAPRFRSYDLTDYLDEKLTVDQLTEAIRAAWELHPESKPESLRIKYHPGTSLLLVNGPDAAVKTVDTILLSIRSKTHGTPAGLEARQLEAVADEVRRRRELRQAAMESGDSPFISPPQTILRPKPPTTTSQAEVEDALENTRRIAEEVRARRAAREQLLSKQRRPTETPPEEPAPTPATP